MLSLCLSSSSHSFQPGPLREALNEGQHWHCFCFQAHRLQASKSAYKQRTPCSLLVYKPTPRPYSRLFERNAPSVDIERTERQLSSAEAPAARRSAATSRDQPRASPSSSHLSSSVGCGPLEWKMPSYMKVPGE